MIVTALSLCCLLEAQPSADAAPQPIVEMWTAPRRVERTTSGGGRGRVGGGVAWTGPELTLDGPRADPSHHQQ